MRSPNVATLALLLATTGVSVSGGGCKPQLRTWPISGEVVFVDKQGAVTPAGADILVSFMPVGEPVDRSGAHAMTDRQGRFHGEVMLRPGQDHPGHYKVALTYPLPPDAGFGLAPGSKTLRRRPIPRQYEDFQMSPLVVDLSGGMQPTMTLKVAD